MPEFPRGTRLPRTAPAAIIALLALLAALVSWTALRASASTAGTVYEAESAALSGGAVTATEHTGYTGSGFVAGYTDTDKGSAATTFAVTAPTAGGYVSTLRYANGTTAAQTLSVYVNGAKVTQISLPATADWSTWGTFATPVTLKSGADTVAYRFDSTDSGNVNLDNITLAAAAAPQAGQYEAESAALSGGAVIAGDHTGFTGSGFVSGYTDGNKGSAATTFSVSAAGAGSTPVTLRYANGTTTTRTLSVYVNGAKVTQISLPATADWNTWGTASQNLTLKAAAFFTGGPSVATSISGYAGSGYLTGFTAQGAQTQIDTAVPSAGTYAVSVAYANSAGSAQTLSLYLNGIKNGQLSLPAGSGWLSLAKSVTLRSGLNLIGLQHDSGDTGNVAVDGVGITGGTALAAQGATVPYTEYRAADATTNGSVLPVSRTYPSLSAEAAGRSAVQLTGTGKYVQVTLAEPANSVVVRYSIPDTASGSPTTAPLALYAGSTKVTDLTLTNKFSWLYGGGYYDTNNPGDGSGHHFYDEVRFKNAATWPAGTVLRFQKDSTAGGTYTVDTIDTELVDAAYAMPAGYVSAATYGVNPGGGDVTAALNSALSAVSGTGQGLWLPAGTYSISGRVSLNNVSLRGAGQWYTTLQSTAENGAGGLYTTGGRNQIADLSVFGDHTFRNNDQGAPAIEGAFTSGSLILNVWMEHAKVGLWAVPGNGLDVAGVRARDIYADGIHVHGGSSGSRVEQSNVRNTGDDNIALDTEGGNVTDCTVSHNTAQSPIQANGIGVYGGGGNVIENNAVSDTVAFGSGITISTAFGQNFSGPTTVRNNLLLRAGSHHSNWNSDIGALWIFADAQGDITQPIAVTGNTLKDSSYQAVLLSFGHTISNLTLDRDTITGAGTYGFDINNVTGSMTVSNTTVSGAASGGLNNAGGYTINRGSGNSGF
ncbi:CBM35 domain-containing protein [Streptomyces sp. IBSBF 2435]|uniref:CBM35 domain-containing protein n=1 Tax=Streptomyces sp. IBSBF 2435 TaxID=2903531 RepID=UPI002FDBFA5F